MRISRIFPAPWLSTGAVQVIKSVTFKNQDLTFAMSAKFYFYFFWYLKPLADREG